MAARRQRQPDGYHPRMDTVTTGAAVVRQMGHTTGKVLEWTRVRSLISRLRDTARTGAYTGVCA